MLPCGLYVRAVHASFITWSCVALLALGAWSPAAFCQASYAVKEPAAPQPSQPIAVLLAESESLRQAVQHQQALQAAGRALAAALAAGDIPGEALSQAARAAAVLDLGHTAEAVAAWQAAAAAWERAGDATSQIEPLVSAALHLQAADSAQAGQLLTRALLVGKTDRQRRFATADALEQAAARIRAFQPALPEAAADAAKFQGAAAALRHEARVGKLLDEDQYVEAEKVARLWLSDVEAATGPDSLETAHALDVLAGALFVTKAAEIPEKKQLAERALAIREKSLEPDHIDVAQSFYTLGRVLWQAGEYRQAQLSWGRSLAIREKTLGPSHGAVRIVLAYLAAVLVDMGDCDAARPLAERFVALLEKAYGPDHPFLGRGLNVLYRVHYCVGNYTDARQVTERALAIKAKAWGEDNASVAADRVILGQLLWEIGDLTESRRNYERALPVFEKVYGAESVYVADGLGGLARVAAGSGDQTAARTLQERVVAIYEKALGPNHPDLAMPLINLAITLGRAGETAQARQLCERALGLSEQARGSASPSVALTLSQLAALLQDTGDLAQARQLYERALAIQESTLTSHPATVAGTLRGLAQLRAMAGDPGEALALALRAEEAGREHWQLIATALSEREALAYARERASGLDLALTLAARDKQATRPVWDGVARSRALVLDEMAARHRTVSNSVDPKTARMAAEFVSARERVARLVVRGPGSEPPQRYHKLLDEARAERELAERALADRSRYFHDHLARVRIGFDQVIAALPQDAALVSYVRYRRYDLAPAAPGGKRADPLPHYLALVWTHAKAEPAIIPLGTAARLESQVIALRRLIARESRTSGVGATRSEALCRQAGARLRRTVWDPVSAHLVGAKRVFIVPDGALHLVNFAALPVGLSRYLLETAPRIHYLSAERDLVPSESQARGRGLLAVGAPAFHESGLFTALQSRKNVPDAPALSSAPAFAAFRGLRSACDNFRALQFEELSASAREAGDVAALWQRPGRMLSGTEGDEAVRLTGAAATKSAFKRQAGGKRVLHLATHGFFLGEQCASALEAGGKPGPASFASLTGENPLLLSGFALAGANHRQAAGPDEEDGILTAEEIAALDLSGVEWAVLSACDTGVGEVRAGEGVLGLRRAFEVAGARTLIMSLWPVEDQVTRDWMRRLYRARLVAGLSTMDAVHQANLSTLRQRRAAGLSTHPFYWAGFVAAGDWR